MLEPSQFGGRDIERRLGRGDDRRPKSFRKSLRNNRNRCSTADGGDCGDVGDRHVGALQRVVDRREQPAQRVGEQVLELRTGDADVRAEAGQLGRDHGGGLLGEPFLGLTALLTQPRQRADRRGARRIGVVGVGDAGQHMVEQGLVDRVPGEVGIAHGLAHEIQIRARVGERDAGAAAAQIDQHHHPLIGQAGRRLQCRQSGRRIGDQRGGHAVGREDRARAQRAPQRPDGAGSPVRGHGDRDR
ncbi:NAD-specific glutamate dehydrogenase [Mycolicibacterium chubuense]|uniref:NAD-specific glutamate dehydrogenase n=1 Tax=Mycolicibacterium chubuense TaxID=1800 RepID=A0A0J6VNU0_MYCCU|nr:NAD-specific glutamate dehydrogenase [Mycolicibacterium chubuense]